MTIYKLHPYDKAVCRERVTSTGSVRGTKRKRDHVIGVWACGHCQMLEADHVDNKCLFDGVLYDEKLYRLPVPRLIDSQLLFTFELD